MRKAELFILIAIVGFKGFVEGSCIEYGHSCWGAHGKRSLKLNTIQPSGSIDIDATSKNLKQHRYILLNVLLDKKSLRYLDEIGDMNESTDNESDERKNDIKPLRKIFRGSKLMAKNVQQHDDTDDQQQLQPDYGLMK